jgi:hypothetical protein
MVYFHFIFSSAAQHTQHSILYMMMMMMCFLFIHVGVVELHFIIGHCSLTSFLLAQNASSSPARSSFFLSLSLSGKKPTRHFTTISKP